MNTYGKTNKTVKRFLCVVSHFSFFFFNIMYFKKYQEDKKGCFPLKNKKRQTKWERDQSKTKGLGSAVCGNDPNLLIYNSQFKQFKLILIITTWFAWVLLLFTLIFFFFLLHPILHQWLTWHGGGELVGWLVSVLWHHPTWTPHSADLQAAGC